MGCNCGKNAEVKFSHIYVDENGKRTTYTSEVQARAAQIRNKGKGKIDKVPA